MKSTLFYNGIFHSGTTEDAVFSYMTTEDGMITGTYANKPLGTFDQEISLDGAHVYPCLIDAHLHLLFTIVSMAMGIQACEVTANGIDPPNIAGVEQRIRAFASKQKKGVPLLASNYVLSAIEEHRLPTKQELDDWAGGRPIVVYNIDGHASALSTEMLKLVGIDPESSDGVLSGEAHERIQGRLTDVISKHVGLADLARGTAMFQNACARYGIGIVGALEGNGDSPKDGGTALLVKMARHFDIGVRVYFQYFDLSRVQGFAKYQKHLRIGGCGDWEMDGSSGAHSAAFSVPYIDTGKSAPCYYSQEEVDNLVRRADKKGYQIASHAIGDAAIERIITALNQTGSGRLHRIEHCEFLSDESFEELKAGRYAVVMQPGYAWIDKRMLHTYTQFLPPEITARMKFKSLCDAGICVCGSSDSPVQDMDPYLQMLGMIEFYNEAESVTPYEAFRTYTINPARAILEENEYGTLEPGKHADFFTADENFFSLTPEGVRDFRPTATYYGGTRYKEKSGSVLEFIRMMMTRGHLV